MNDTLVLLISGSTRAGSSNTQALEALRGAAEGSTRTDVYAGLRHLPAFVPNEEPVPAEVVDLLQRIGEADAVVFSTPEYAGGVPGSLKNLLDWTVGGGELYEKPVAWLDVANPGRGEGARRQLETVLTYVGARIVDAACVHLTIDRSSETPHLAPESDQQLRVALGALLAAARRAA